MIKFGESFSLDSLLNQSQTYQGNPCGVYPDLSSFTGSGVYLDLSSFVGSGVYPDLSSFTGSGVYPNLSSFTGSGVIPKLYSLYQTIRSYSGSHQFGWSFWHYKDLGDFEGTLSLAKDVRRCAKSH